MSSNDKATHNKIWLETEKTAQKRIEQVRALKEQASKGGLRFESYLTPDLAVWVLNMVERGDFIDPSEAIFVLMQQAKDLDRHDDLKQAIISRKLGAAMKDVQEGKHYTLEEVKQHLKETLQDKAEPAIWLKISQEQDKEIE